MTEETKTTQNKGADSSPNDENTANVTLGGKSYTIKRLKAGKFYSALKVYMAMVKEVTPKNASDKDEAQVDLNQLVSSMFESWPGKMAEFVAICCSTATVPDGDGVKEANLTTQFILDESYPEEISEAFQTCLKVNKVAQSLKNFVAPIGELGAVAPEQNQDK